VIVGPKEVEFFVQKHLVCGKSDFFKSLCTKKWESVGTNTLTLRKADPDLFSLFLAWILTGSVENAEEFVEVIGDDNYVKFIAATRQMRQLAKSFIFADDLQSVSYSNHIIDQVVQNCQSQDELGYVAGTYKGLNDIWHKTPRGSPLRLLLVQDFVNGHTFPIELTEEEEAKVPRGFMLDLFQYLGEALRDKTKLKEVWKKPPCTYHKHPTEDDRLSCISKAVPKGPRAR
jgi:hypothetical protein